METPWHHHVMWWHVYPLGFTGAPVRPGPDEVTGVVHRLDRVTAWLDHVVELGLNGLMLGPVFASQSHGYDTVDHFRIDPRLGDDADFDRLVAAARARGVRILLDGVFNHVGRAHPAFAGLQGPDSPGADLFRIHRDDWTPGNPVHADVFEGHDQLVALDHRSPAVEDLVVTVMNHWLGRGIDGWRLDAAYAVPPRFWAAVLPHVRKEYPDAWFSGEVIHGDYADLVQRSTVDTLTQYELWQGVWHGIADRNFFELTHALERHQELLGTFVPQTFLGNHDVTRIATAVGPELVPHALAVLFCVAGTPSVYAGDEYLMTGTKEQREGGDDAIRPEFPPRPPDPGTLPADQLSTLRLHQDLIGLRRRKRWLRTVHADVVQLANRQLVLRCARDEDAVVVALNLDTCPARVPAAGAREVLLGTGQLEGSTVSLPALGWAVLQG